ncbi:MAG: serine/threonine protein kinase, partial [Deltaproteobacteria bacterium]|nr:serine/threonine protein kinase [Deltaproteobacteria bacterium]
MAAEHGYERLTPLATGGMAELLLAVRASTPGFRKLVVLKRVLPVHAAEPSFTRMFLREARIAASLDHPNVVQVYDSGWSDGRTFLAMEYVHGADLRQLIRAVAAQQQVVPLPFVLTIMAGLCAGLHYVHERCSPQGEPQGLVHRDVSPSNVLISEEGAVKLADFGVAAATAESIATRSGSIKGKLAYMAPEQARGESIDRRADIFGLGAVLYELSTGHRPFRAANDAALLYRVLEAQPERPSTLVADYPPQLEAIVMRALAKDPAARQPTAQVLQLELEELALSQGLPLSPTRLGHYVVQCCGAKASPTLLGEPGGTAVGPAAADLDRVSSTVTATRSRRLWPWATVAAAVVLLVVWGAAVWTADAGSEREDPAGASGSAVVAAPSSDAEVGTQPPPVARLPAAQAETTAS